MGQQHWSQRTGMLKVVDSESEDEAENEGDRGNDEYGGGDNEQNEAVRGLEDQEEKTEEGEEAKEKKGETIEYTDVISIRDMFGNSTRRKSLIYLALTFFSYHLVNATVLPLLGQY